jgi:hypothetical protein
MGIRIPERDSAGRDINRVTEITPGRTMHERAVQFTTSTLESLFNSEFTDVFISFLAADDTELTTQETIDTSCVKTKVSFRPTFSYDIIGGFAEVANRPDQHVRVDVIAAPGVLNTRLVSGVSLKISPKVVLDGRTAKDLPYIEGLPINWIDMVFSHPAGYKIEVQVVWELFK